MKTPTLALAVTIAAVAGPASAARVAPAPRTKAESAERGANIRALRIGLTAVYKTQEPFLQRVAQAGGREGAATLKVVRADAVRGLAAAALTKGAKVDVSTPGPGSRIHEVRVSTPAAIAGHWTDRGRVGGSSGWSYAHLKGGWKMSLSHSPEGKHGGEANLYAPHSAGVFKQSW